MQNFVIYFVVILSQIDREKTANKNLNSELFHIQEKKSTYQLFEFSWLFCVTVLMDRT